jgi:hypothetical protein
MSLDPGFIDSSFNRASILDDPFTFGVRIFTYAYRSLIAGGTPLFQASDMRTFLAHETVVPEPRSWAIGVLVCGAIAPIRFRNF